MAAVIEAVGPCRMTMRRGRYAALVRAIVGQQVSTAAARAIYERVRSAGGGYVTAERLADLKDPDLRSCGLSRQKISYVRDLTERIGDGRLRLDRMAALDDEAAVQALCEVRGVGKWTAEIFLMFVLARPDVLPIGDLGVRQGFMRVYGLRKEPSAGRMHAIAQPWRPYRSVGSWYLWRALETQWD
jgi:DNA-3-methyladenine glycosylase II